jgi:hypothetical protein
MRAGKKWGIYRLNRATTPAELRSEVRQLRAEWRRSLLRLDQRQADPRPRFWRRRQVPEVVLAIPTARTRGLDSVKLTDFSLKSYYFAIRADLPHAASSQP